MVQFTHLRIAHTKISFYFGNPKSRGKICGVRQNAGRMQQRKTGDSRHTAGCGGVQRKTAFGSRHKKRGKPRLSSLLVNPLGSEYCSLIHTGAWRAVFLPSHKLVTNHCRYLTGVCLSDTRCKIIIFFSNVQFNL